MKQVIEIEVPEGHIAKYIPEKDNKVVFLGKPKTWEEFYENYPVQPGESYMEADGCIVTLTCCPTQRILQNLCTSKEEAEAFLALIKLRQLRKAWVGDWKPNYSLKFKQEPQVWHIHRDPYGFTVDWSNIPRPLSFPHKSMAFEFIACFRDLLVKAKRLL